MADFNVRADAVNVEQIMEQIRSRIREKRGVDYTDEQIRELATVKLQKFLDPRGVRSDLLDQFRRTQPPYQPPELPNYAFEEDTLFDSHRAPLRAIRRLLKPILKLFFNPNPLIQALHIQSHVNTMLAEREARLEASKRSTESLYYELIHNLVVETTRLGIEVKNLAMRIESLSSRLEFNERRARALESAVVYMPAPGDLVVTAAPTSPSSATVSTPSRDFRPPQPTAHGSQDVGSPVEGPGQRSRRRRRRRGRRNGPPATSVMGGSAPSPGSDASVAPQPSSEASAAEPSQPRELPAAAPSGSEPDPQ
jgi:hypothetical protein